jgi:hypothetical protein
MDLAVLSRVGGFSAGETSCQRLGKVVPDGLKSTLDRRRAGEGRSERPLETAVFIDLALFSSSIGRRRAVGLTS